MLIWPIAIICLCGLPILYLLTREKTLEDVITEEERKAAKMLFKRRKKAERKIDYLPEVVQNHQIIGYVIDGDLYSMMSGNVALMPQDLLSLHLMVLGETGRGKTQTVLRLAHGAAKFYGYRVFYLDCKGSYDTAVKFVAAMRGAGHRAVKMFPAEKFDGFRGGTAALLNRLLAVQDFTEPFYYNIASTVLHLALNAAPTPRTSRELLGRLDLSILRKLYAGTERQHEVSKLRVEEVRGVFARYRAFFNLVPGIDGGFGFDDCESAYLLVDGTALKDEAKSLARFMIEDFSHFVARRKNGDQKVLLVVDEVSAISDGTDIANLFERIREAGGAIIATSQTYASLGEQADRILGACGTVVLHTTKEPDQLIKYAGTRKRPEMSVQYDSEEGATGRGSARLQDTFKVDPNLVRQLPKGEAVFINSGQYAQIRVSMGTFSVEGLTIAESIVYPQKPTTATEHPVIPPLIQRPQPQQEAPEQQAPPPIDGSMVVLSESDELPEF